MSEPLLQMVPAHELVKSRDCSIAGCDQDASDAPTRGPLVNKCAAHRAAVVEKQRKATVEFHARRRELRNQPPPENGQPNIHAAATGEIAAAARKLVPHAARLDKALAAKRDASAHAKQALAEFKTAWAEIKDSVDGAIGNR